jgi:hypothetical protein
MAAVKERAQRDLALAQRISGQIDGRSQQFEVAAENLQPGSRPAAPPARQTTLRQSAPIKATPNASSPTIATARAREPVTVTGSRNGYALVQTASGERGYAPLDALAGGRASVPQRADSGDARTLAGSNAARRDDFAASVAVSQQAVANSFELAG